MKLPLCVCGCGDPVANEKNKYINGHNRRNMPTDDNTKEKIRYKLKGKKPWNKGKTKDNSGGVLRQSEKLKEMRRDSNSIFNTKEFKNNHNKSMNNPKTKRKISISSMGRTSPNKGVGMTSSQKKKISNKLKMRIRDIKIRYPFFSRIEEMRYNPDKPGEKEIQVHCKNHNCSNSKEKGGWFTPTRTQFQDRRNWLENEGKDICSFYCSNECKNNCPLYNLRIDPFQTEYKSYTTHEYQQFREYVLKRDNYKCQYCGRKVEHVHHERPQKLEPFFALDPDLAWSVCKKCHYEKGHKDECSTGKLASIVCE
ncbi:MAG TPA: NUMOD3 domain-containing DNA-binding protein [Candidatus Glassbacteria bacterium]|nr:NUMOD3 domain-containing DNA-binding protein [Candidatus Glassbacteria bacterium]